MRRLPWLAAVAALAACTSRPPQPAPPAPPDPRSGETRVRSLSPPPAGEATIETAESITPAYASADNALPEFPRYALDAGCSGGVVTVRLFVGADGNVTGSEELAPPPGGRCHAALSGAVHAAVGRWRFAPAFRVRQVPAGDGSSRLPRWEQTPIPVYLDFEFTFLVRDGRPAVEVR